MQLPEGERALLAYFPSSTRAQDAASELKDQGFVPDSESIQIDRVSRFGASSDANYNSPINNANTLSGVTIFSSQGNDVSPLLAADPSASGMSDGGNGMAGGHAFLLTLVTNEKNVKEAVNIIKQYGGDI